MQTAMENTVGTTNAVTMGLLNNGNFVISIFEQADCNFNNQESITMILTMIHSTMFSSLDELVVIQTLWVWVVFILFFFERFFFASFFFFFCFPIIGCPNFDCIIRWVMPYLYHWVDGPRIPLLVGPFMILIKRWSHHVSIILWHQCDLSISVGSTGTTTVATTASTIWSLTSKFTPVICRIHNENYLILPVLC